jgi:uncharacterized damage-inducible protein DinB
MNAATLVKLYEISGNVLKKNVDGISHAESLVRPQPGGNCLNWVLGHIVAVRNTVLTLVGREPAWSSNETTIYDRGTTLDDDSKALDISSLIAAFDQSQAQIMSAIKDLSAEELAKPIKGTTPGGTIGEKLAFFSWHEGYHLGQIGILRRLAGKEGAIV